MWIQVGNVRINLDNVAKVSDHVSNELRYSTINDKRVFEDCYASPEETFKGLVVKVTFNATSDDGNLQHTFYTEQAEEFLELFNAYALVMDIETLREKQAFNGKAQS